MTTTPAENPTPDPQRKINTNTGRPWPIVLVIDRIIPVKRFSPHLHWTDSCGTRSVWYYNEQGDDYDTATDLPEELFNKIVTSFKNSSTVPKTMLRIQDPGLGIYIPSIDNPIRHSS
jgi:hypothetical protein